MEEDEPPGPDRVRVRNRAFDARMAPAEAAVVLLLEVLRVVEQ